MSVTAKQLSKSGARGKELDAIVREQLQVIDDRLLRAERTWGRNVVEHELPTNLAMPGLLKPDGQRIVYSAIVRSLTKRGFEVALLLEEARSALFIVWVTDLDTREIQAMNQLIRTARISREKLPAFVGAGKGGGVRPRDPGTGFRAGGGGGGGAEEEAPPSGPPRSDAPLPSAAVAVSFGT